MNNPDDFIIKKGTLVKYIGKASDVTIPDGVSKIGSRAFQNCTVLESVTVAGSVRNIDEWAFYQCRRLRNVNILDGTVNIASTAFRFCTALETVTVPPSVKVIGHGAFFACGKCDFYFKGRTFSAVPTDFADIYAAKGFAHNFEKNVESAEAAESYAGFLKEYMYKTSAAAVAEDGAFIRLLINRVMLDAEETNVLLSSLKDGTNPEERAMLIEYMNSLPCQNDVLDGYERMLEDDSVPLEVALREWRLEKADDGGFVLASYIGDKTEIICPSKIGQTRVSAISEAVFSGCMCKKSHDIISVILPEGITEIPERAFSGCNMLESVRIPDGVKAIREGAFGYCYSLESVNIPESMKYIGENAFLECLCLKNIYIPDSVERIDSSAFLNCSGIDTITVGSRGLKIAGNAFHDCGSPPV